MTTPGKSVDLATRPERARLSLEGLSVGDAFGECFFVSPAVAQTMVEERVLPREPWRYTDDTEMALAIVRVLEEHGRINQDALARLFGQRYRRNPRRGYGATAHDILQKIHLGLPWREVSSEVFEGTGSLGNGGAMRVAPLGAWFADDLGRVVSEARASAEVTHFHPEGQAGAIAIAVAAAWAHRWQETRPPARQLFEAVLDHTPPGETRAGLEKAREWPLEATPTSAARTLGSGQRVISQDTVPFSVWCAARHLDSYEEALWSTVAGMGDRDTTCAIVGGIVALSAGRESIPRAWLSAREPLDAAW
ncbi:MAG TPA: ADP-ribosylglycohydrolase family protein [Archangium sp.]|nr:ADP-ribosylglycohydrolase family protein [Archangium sp.]